VTRRIQLTTLIAALAFTAACSGNPSLDAGRTASPATRRIASTRPATTAPTNGIAPSPLDATSPVTGDVTGSGTTLGSTDYPVPTGAIIVASNGDDTAQGTVGSPMRTLGRAVAAARAGATIVLRGGTYHESVTIPAGKAVTVQNWPGEVVWLDGSEAVTGWIADGGRWRRDGWNLTFDHSPTYTRGAADSTKAYWGFVSATYPMAAHPDQMWIDGQAQVQAPSVDQVGPGAFHKDDPAGRLYLGTDPTGHDVRAATLVKALSIRAAGTTVRGIGFRRYSPSVPDMGAITAEAPGITLEHLVVSEMATTGVSVLSTGAVLRNLDVSRAGMLGIHANQADGLRVLGVNARQNNVEHFNSSPVSGGFKVTRTRGVTVSKSTFRDNLGPGVWADESVYDIRITGCDLTGNTGHGISLELSAKAIVADDVIVGNGGNGIKVNNTSDVTLVNNTFVGNNRPVNIVQDSRRASNPSTPGHDPRQPFPDPTMTWINGPVLVQGNVISAPAAGNCLLCVEDYSREFTAEQLRISTVGNVYHRVTAASPTWLVVWSRGGAGPAVFNDLASFQAATGQEAAGLSMTGTAVTDLSGRRTAAVQQFDQVAPPLTGALATLIGQADGARRFGAFR